MSARERRAKTRREQKRTMPRAAAPVAVSGALIAAALVGMPASAEAVTLTTSRVANINTVGIGSSPSDITVVGNTGYFAAYKPGVGNELWKTDGTAGGTSLVDDILPGPGDSDPGDLTNVGDTLYFVANDGSGDELWKTDGTAAGTEQLTTLMNGSYPTDITVVNGDVYFQDDGELWKSAGTPATTVQLAAVAASGYYVSDITNVGGTIYFADEGELWKSDGTANGTTEVADPATGRLTELTNLNGTLFFSAPDGAGGGALWTSDGTAQGTIVVKAFDASGISFQNDVTGLTNLNGTLIFDTEEELWSSDGTAAATQTISDVDVEGGSYPYFAVADGKAYFFGFTSGSSSLALWETDGTDSGTIELSGLADGAPSSLTAANGGLFFKGGQGLMYDDGVPGDTPIALGGGFTQLSPPGNLANLNGTLLFSGNDGTHGPELWKSGGTPSNTSQILVIDENDQANDGSDPNYFTNVNGTVYFAADDGIHGTELWKTDGTDSGTTMVDDLDPGSDPSFPLDLTNVNGTLYFVSDDKLYKTSGTAATTAQVAVGDPGDFVEDLVVAGDSLYVVEYPQVGVGPDLWVSNGSTFSRLSGVDSVSDVTNVGGTVYFAASDGTHGVELWKSDGTDSGTTMVDDIDPGAASGGAEGITPIGNDVYFWADDGTNGTQLWKSDGSITTSVSNVSPVPSSNYPGVPQLTNVDGTLYFAGDDGTHGAELWSVNGTDVHMVDDIQAGTDGSDPLDLTNVDGTLYFTATTTDAGQELWTSDGTVGGTKLVRDIDPGAASTYVGGLVNDNGLLAFVADDGTHGYELWQSDGSAEGTVEVSDILPGPDGAMEPNFDLLPVGGTLFFAANDGTNGTELWDATEPATNGGGGGSGPGTGGGSSGTPGGTGSGSSGGGSSVPPPASGANTNNGIPSSLTFRKTKISGDAATFTFTVHGSSTGSYKILSTLSVVETMSGKKVLGVAAADHPRAKKSKKPVKKTVVIGSKTVQVKGGNSVSETVTLNGAGKKLLSQRHRLSVKLAVTAKGKSLASKTLTFIAPKKKKK
jgi:ELWxxDGT repeat protein